MHPFQHAREFHPPNERMRMMSPGPRGMRGPRGPHGRPGPPVPLGPSDFEPSPRMRPPMYRRPSGDNFMSCGPRNQSPRNVPPRNQHVRNPQSRNQQPRSQHPVNPTRPNLMNVRDFQENARFLQDGPSNQRNFDGVQGPRLNRPPQIMRPDSNQQRFPNPSHLKRNNDECQMQNANWSHAEPEMHGPVGRPMPMKALPPVRLPPPEKITNEIPRLEVPLEAQPMRFPLPPQQNQPSGRKTLLAMPQTVNESHEPELFSGADSGKRGILPPPDSLVPQIPVSTIVSSSTTNSTPSTLLPPPVADISRPPPGFKDLQSPNSKPNAPNSSETVTKDSLPHPSTLLSSHEQVATSIPYSGVSDVPELNNVAPVPVPPSVSERCHSTVVEQPVRPAVSQAPAPFPQVCIAVPPPNMVSGILPPNVGQLPPPFSALAQAAGKNLNFLPSSMGENPLVPDVLLPSNLPHAPPTNLSVPPPIINAVPQPGEGHHNLPPLHLPPPGYAATTSKADENAVPDNSISAAADLGDEEYAKELRQWRQQIEDYEKQMMDYFQKCRDRLLEFFPSDPSTADASTQEAYRREYEKLQEEYQNFSNYMEPMREYLTETKAEMTKEGEKNASDMLGDLPSLPPTAAAEQPPPPPPSEAPPSTAPAPPPPDDSIACANALTQLASDYGDNLDDSNAPAAQYYSQYYRQMIDYYQQLLKSMHGGEAGGSSTEESDEDLKNLNKVKAFVEECY